MILLLHWRKPFGAFNSKKSRLRLG